jgi:hypothetical protein
MSKNNKINKNKKNRKIDIWSDEVVCEYCGAVVRDGLTCQECGELTGFGYYANEHGWVKGLGPSDED